MFNVMTCGLLIILNSCKVEEPIASKIVRTNSVSNITSNTATFNGTVLNSDIKSVFETGFVFSDKSSNPSFSDYTITADNKIEFTSDIKNLKVNTKYYVKAYLKNSSGSNFGDLISFSTGDFSLTILNTFTPTNVTFTSAVLGGTVVNDGGTNVSEKGFCLSLTPSPTINDQKFKVGIGLGNFILKVENLNDGTKYYVRSYAINSKGVAYGEEYNFTTTPYSVPTVKIGSTSSIGANSLTIKGQVVENGGLSVSDRGFCYSLSPEPTILNNKISVGSGMGEFYTQISNLKENTTYYFKTYSTNPKGTSYSDQIKISTSSLSSFINGIKNGIISFYPLNNNLDYSGNGYDLSVNGAVNLSPTGLDRFGNSKTTALFDGFSGLYNNSSKLIDNKEGLTISFWAKTGLYNPVDGIFNTKYIGLNLINNSSKEVNLYISKKNYLLHDEFKTNNLNLTSKIYFDNEWHHIVGVFDYVDKYVYLYIDGELQEIVNTEIKNLGNFYLSIGSSYERLFINSANADSEFNRRGWSGYIDETAIWNRSLNADEVKIIYKNQLKP